MKSIYVATPIGTIKVEVVDKGEKTAGGVSVSLLVENDFYPVSVTEFDSEEKELRTVVFKDQENLEDTVEVVHESLPDSLIQLYWRKYKQPSGYRYQLRPFLSRTGVVHAHSLSSGQDSLLWSNEHRHEVFHGSLYRPGKHNTDGTYRYTFLFPVRIPHMHHKTPDPLDKPGLHPVPQVPRCLQILSYSES